MQHCAGFISADSLYGTECVLGRYLPNTHSVPALIRRCDELPATITHVPVAAVLILITPDDGRLRPKHVE